MKLLVARVQDDVVEWLNARRVNKSQVVRDLLKRYMEHMKEQESAKIIKCSECGCEYSTAIGYCPQCDENRLKNLLQAKPQ